MDQLHPGSDRRAQPSPIGCGRHVNGGQGNAGSGQPGGNLRHGRQRHGLGQRLEEVLVKAVAETDAAPFETVVAAFHRVADEIFADRLDLVRVRQSIIEGSPELQERELRKMGSLAAAVAAALRAKGVGETTAILATESGVTVFRMAFARWVAPGCDASLTDLITEVVAELRAVTSPPDLHPDLGHC